MLFSATRRRGFTLIELMTVIGIIVLLVGILIPALSSVRKRAKEAATANVIKSLSDGCEMFHGDFGYYPQSRGYNPFEGESAQIPLMGAQWLALQLSGPDGRGFVNPIAKNDANGDDRIDENDWLNWYDLPTNQTREFSRNGPYADPDGKQTSTIQKILEYDPDQTMMLPEGLVSSASGGSGGSSVWNNEYLPFYVDLFEYPILYYAATPNVEAPFTTGTPGGSFSVGKYDQADNAFFTGSDGQNGRFPVNTPGWDLTEAHEQPYLHPLGTLGYTEDQNTWPEEGTFASFICNAKVFENTRRGNQGVLQPHNPDTFILISAGQDGVYGSTDDVVNFEKNY